jgi:CheY-like chemotaxis protein
MSIAQAGILFIDDDPVFLRRTQQLFNQLGILVKAVANSGKEAISRIMEQYFNFDLIMLDLDLPEMDGIEIYKEIRKLNSKIPVIFASAHFGEATWEQKLNKINNDINKVPKPFPVTTSEDFLTIQDIIKGERGRYRKELLNPFKYTLSDFLNLSDDEMEVIFEEASEINGRFVEFYIKKNPNVDWVIIAKEPGNIVASGKKKDEPYEEEIEQLARDCNSPVFTYSRPKLIEETDIKCSKRSQNTKWCNKSNSEDFYPTVTFLFKSEPEHIIQCDFDTGCEESFFSLQKFRDFGLIKGRPLWSIESSSAEIREQKIKYYKKKLKCELVGKKNRKDVELSCNLVKNWKDSPFLEYFKKRDALVGRDMLLLNKVKLILDGENRETDIIV